MIGKAKRFFSDGGFDFKRGDKVDELKVGTSNFSTYLNLDWIEIVDDVEITKSVIRPKGKPLVNITVSPPYLTKGDGYGSSSMEIVRHLNRHIDTYVTNYQNIVNMNFGQDGEIKKIIAKGVRNCPVHLNYGYPTAFNRPIGSVFVAGFTMWETDTVPLGFADSCNEMDLIIVPSKSCKDVLVKCGVSVPVEVVPLGVSQEFHYLIRDWETRAGFTILTLGAMDKGNRKGWIELAKAFMLAFPESEYPDHRLIIKAKPNIRFNEHTFWLKDTRISWLGKWLEVKEHLEILKKADLFSFVSHGEGFGLPPLEAIATGLPTLVSNAMGLSQWATEDIVEILDLNEVEPASYPDSCGEVGNWSKIDIDVLADKLTWAYKQRIKLREKAKAVAHIVSERFNYDLTAKGIITAVEKYYCSGQYQAKVKISYQNMINGVNIPKVDIPLRTYDHKAKISFIIPTYGKEELVKNCIKAIRGKTQHSYEIIVVDDGFGIKQINQNIKMVKHDSNMGFARSVNDGIAEASNEYIILVNDDVFIQDKCAEEIVYALQQKGDIVGAKLFYPDGTIQHAGVSYLGRHLFYHNCWHKPEGGDQPLRCLVTGALMGFSRATYDRVGKFNEAFFVAYEDVDFNFRAIKAGFKVIYWPFARAVHIEGATRGRDHQTKLARNPKAYQLEAEGMAKFKTMYSDKEVRKLCINSQL